MDTLSYNAPGILFPAISLLMLAFTNRFLGLSSLTRQLLDKYRESEDPNIEAQVRNLVIRISHIRFSQTFGILSMTFCTASILFIAIWNIGAWICFGLSLFSMLTSLVFSLLEIRLSVRALELEIHAVFSWDSSR
ncbi:DUF2721 domain-containing protein [Leptospira haakeii]|uniref:DUF2721 domain-containing protein n=1 Tax=Leptospira haakeii TaxID=2023198 RepID=A0ABX4PIK4_9LEPT|nr:DUF2721 domain-containing protein [Leptospira haakeii]PKA15599.1 hypothetical protein CH363_13440 [Leptospira haakeii]PKA18966.1 hypothetical protein CH377_15335 [Leptospira haakeii]